MDPPKNINVSSDGKIISATRECTGEVLDIEGTGRGCLDSHF